MTTVEFTITVEYPTSTTEEDFQDHLEELVDTMYHYGFDVDGYFKVI